MKIYEIIRSFFVLYDYIVSYIPENLLAENKPNVTKNVTYTRL